MKTKISKSRYFFFRKVREGFAAFYFTQRKREKDLASTARTKATIQTTSKQTTSYPSNNTITILLLICLLKQLEGNITILKTKCGLLMQQKPVAWSSSL